MLAFDFLGFGLSAKPRDHVYSLLWQADLVEDLLRRVDRRGRSSSSPTTWAPRSPPSCWRATSRGAWASSLPGAAVQRQHRPGARQPDAGAAAAAQPVRRARRAAHQRARVPPAVRRPLLGRSIRSTHEEAADQWSLICHNGGRTLATADPLPRRARALRRALARRGARLGGPAELRLGAPGPGGTTAVLDALIELRPGAPVERLPELGHYPQLEDPAAIAAALRARTRAGDGLGDATRAIVVSDW